ncbi:DUF1330 domain-containing protein [uncultured Tenacibaculum sp.]|uniref:DUF1330 domain-containing protein n=1 Tax=uncultured Tenacibaculum sp. TaxID=174713 RepID=UPI0026310F74|nr:DUF1330 domain-containing protein [uncultured Tenacibaculum sp.]
MKRYIDVTQESGREFYLKYQGKGKIVMLNLLKFKEVADYTNLETIKPKQEISGKEAYELYMIHTLPCIKKYGSKVLFKGSSKNFVIGPIDETWDYVLLVEHESVEKFMSFAQDETYLATAGHRKAALLDSRLLPISE